MDNSLRIQIAPQIRMTREKGNCSDYYTKQTGWCQRDAGRALVLSGLTDPRAPGLHGTHTKQLFDMHTHTHMHTHVHTCTHSHMHTFTHAPTHRTWLRKRVNLDFRKSLPSELWALEGTSSEDPFQSPGASENRN